MGWTSLECECGASIIGPSTIARPCCLGPCRTPRSTRCLTSTASMCKARWGLPFSEPSGSVMCYLGCEAEGENYIWSEAGIAHSWCAPWLLAGGREERPNDRLHQSGPGAAPARLPEDGSGKPRFRDWCQVPTSPTLPTGPWESQRGLLPSRSNLELDSTLALLMTVYQMKWGDAPPSWHWQRRTGKQCLSLGLIPS